MSIPITDATKNVSLNLFLRLREISHALPRVNRYASEVSKVALAVETEFSCKAEALFS
jgi:hypothetical protein